MSKCRRDRLCCELPLKADLQSRCLDPGRVRPFASLSCRFRQTRRAEPQVSLRHKPTPVRFLSRLQPHACRNAGRISRLLPSLPEIASPQCCPAASAGITSALLDNQYCLPPFLCSCPGCHFTAFKISSHPPGSEPKDDVCA